MIELTKKQMQIFDGLMISDAYLSMGKRRKNARFGLTCKYREFAEKVKTIFSEFLWSTPPIRTRDIYDKRTEKYYSSTTLSSRTDEFLTMQYSRWYPDGKKIVPTDIEIDKDMLLWWYIGDGHLRRKKNRPNFRNVGLATMSFSNNDVDILIDKLKIFLGEESIYKDNRNCIHIASQSLCNFADLFKNISPLRCYDYKFEFGQYLNKNYLKNSYKTRPIYFINEFRKKNKVRELDFISKQDIRKVG